MEQIDEAQLLEQLHTERALREQRARRLPDEPQWMEDGAVRCLDCADVIPAGRLRAVPTACRCCECQTRQDRQRAQNPALLTDSED